MICPPRALPKSVERVDSMESVGSRMCRCSPHCPYSPYFTRSIFKDVATADRVTVQIGGSRYRIPHVVRRDLRRLLDRGEPLTDGSTSP
jgi:hypothetical protein